jgi:hypothetical protein
MSSQTTPKSVRSVPSIGLRSPSPEPESMSIDECIYDMSQKIDRLTEVVAEIAQAVGSIMHKQKTPAGSDLQLDAILCSSVQDFETYNQKLSVKPPKRVELVSYFSENLNF